jgi:hypothetical protein
MILIPNIGGMFLSLSLGLTPLIVTQAAENKSPASCADRKGGQSDLRGCGENPRGLHTVDGDVLRVEFDHLIVIQRSDGKEAQLHIDEHTDMFGYVSPGEHIKAKVNEESHALSIRSVDSP